MSNKQQQAIVNSLLEHHGRSFSEELGLKVEKNTPSILFQLLYASLLFSARISASAATEAHRALRRAGWTTPQKMAQATWAERTRVLNQHGYARYDERTSRMLGDTAELVLEDYGGDLRNLREEAGHDPQAERKRLKAFKGIGDVGADIFLREAQVVWDELFPYADERALAGAEHLGLPTEPRELARLVDRQDYHRLVDALVRVELAKDHEEIKKAARLH